MTAHLLAAGADPNALDNEGYTPLHHAAAHGESRRVVARLLAAGADPLAESNNGRTPLHYALLDFGDYFLDLSGALVQAGAAANLTPLQLAALESDAEAVTSLLVEGADPNVVDGYGWGPLHLAVLRADPEVVSALLEAGADPNAQSVDGLTALHLAARHRTSVVVTDVLLRAGADPNAEADAEEAAGTPLHTAAMWNYPVVVLALLDAGADAAKRDGNGRRPVDFARSNFRITGSAAYPRLLVPRPTALVAGRAVTGDLQPGDGVTDDGVTGFYSYYEEWSYSARAGQRVVITVDSESVNPSLRVLRDDGTEVGSGYDDDGGPGNYNTRVEFQAPATGRYTILVASVAGPLQPPTGRYTILVSSASGLLQETGDTRSIWSGLLATREKAPEPCLPGPAPGSGPRDRRLAAHGAALAEPV